MAETKLVLNITLDSSQFDVYELANIVQNLDLVSQINKVIDTNSAKVTKIIVNVT